MLNNITRELVTQAALTVRQRYYEEEGFTKPRDINEGMCEKFASDVVAELAEMSGNKEMAYQDAAQCSA